MLGNLKRLIEYSKTITEGIEEAPRPHIVGDEDEGTTLLNSPIYVGPQIVVSLPMTKLSGNCDNMTGDLVFIVFVLEKSKSSTATPEGQVAQYLSTIDLLDAILEKFTSDIAGLSADGGCPLLAGMELVDADVMPETGRFGGWNGYSATITLK